MNIDMLLNEFMSLVAEGKVEVYNEFSLQHELGIFLRAYEACSGRANKGI